MTYISMTPPIDYIILDFNQKCIYYKYEAGIKYLIFKGNTKVYNRFRHSILKENGTFCSECGCFGNIIHHIKPANKSPNLYYCVDNIRVLCKECHKNIHHEEGY